MQKINHIYTKGSFAEYSMYIAIRASNNEKLNIWTINDQRASCLIP